MGEFTNTGIEFTGTYKPTGKLQTANRKEQLFIIELQSIVPD